jgi:hypothetical protein
MAVFVRQLVSGVQPLEHVTEDAQKHVERHGLAALGRRLDDLMQRRAIDVVHDQEQAFGSLIHVVRSHHVRVADTRRQSCLVQEHRNEVGVARDVRVHDFDRNQPLESAGCLDAPEVHGRHPTCRQGAQHFVASERLQHRSKATSCKAMARGNA